MMHPYTEQGEEVEQLRELLETELPASGLLEHWAGLLLTVTESHSMDAALSELRHSAHSAFADVLHRCQSCLPYALSSQLPSSPSLSLFLSCHIVSACADLGCGGGEGGTYGMPPAFRLPEGASPQSHMLSTCLCAWAGAVRAERQRLLAALGGEAPAAKLSGCPLRALYRRELSLLQQRQGQDGEEGQQPPAETEAAAARELEAARQRLELSATLPLNTTATFELCMRLAGAAMAAAAGAPKPAAGASSPSSGGSHGQAAACGMSAKDALGLAEVSLQCARAVLAGEEALREPHVPPALAARLGRWWELFAVSVTAIARDELTAAKAAHFIFNIFVRLVARKGPTTQPSADMAAAVRGGCLRCLTSLLPLVLRPGSEPVLHTSIFLSYGDTWIKLLAFGKTAEAVLLVAAAAEALALHTAALAQPRAAGAMEAATAAAQACMWVSVFFGSRLLNELWRPGRCVPARSSGTAGEANAVGAAGATAGYLPSGAVASVVVARLLPEMARLLQGLLQRLHAGALSEADADDVRSVLVDVLCIVPWPAVGLAHATCALGEARQSADGGGGSDDDRAGSDGAGGGRGRGDSGGGGGDDGAAASWRQLLLVELRLPALLGAALRLLEQDKEAAEASRRTEGQASFLRRDPIGDCLGRALVALAAWAPAELARVVAAANRASAGERGGRSGALPTTALLRLVLGRDGCSPAPEVLEAVEAACGGAGPQRVPAFLQPEEWEPLLQCCDKLLPPVRARELLATSDSVP
ncbi:hypothetical protein GPECTOR_59g687 [Gonium pectorale]|uniref:Uncharacterized protein n=1 Tax=Gonium pectorale TaxID=33097 RepID=A0A150G5I2_GONPE|nr:hypothetical protein GPECTOR_59g687 [Gonium pectorale]|eukprot:KXZ45078.1 hypothetical protein GPECTOR_59g687 [Gonium pectorale]